MADTFLTTAQVAERYQVDTETVRTWIRSNRLPAINLTPNGTRARFRIREADLEQFEKLLSTQKGARSGTTKQRTVAVKNLAPLPGGLQYF